MTNHFPVAWLGELRALPKGLGQWRKADIDELEKQYADLEEIWQAEKAALQGAQEYKAELEQARVELEQARRAGDLNRMSELQYGVIPELEKKVKAAQDQEEQQSQTENQLLRNKVTDEEIAEVVSKWTGIPVAKMLEGEKDKLLRMEEALHQRVVGQAEAVEAVAKRIVIMQRRPMLKRRGKMK